MYAAPQLLRDRGSRWPSRSRMRGSYRAQAAPRCSSGRGWWSRRWGMEQSSGRSCSPSSSRGGRSRSTCCACGSQATWPGTRDATATSGTRWGLWLGVLGVAGGPRFGLDEGRLRPAGTHDDARARVHHPGHRRGVDRWLDRALRRGCQHRCRCLVFEPPRGERKMDSGNQLGVRERVRPFVGAEPRLVMARPEGLSGSAGIALRSRLGRRRGSSTRTSRSVTGMCGPRATRRLRP